MRDIHLYLYVLNVKTTMGQQNKTKKKQLRTPIGVCIGYLDSDLAFWIYHIQKE
jgi:hypothetical protein